MKYEDAGRGFAEGAFDWLTEKEASTARNTIRMTITHIWVPHTSSG